MVVRKRDRSSWDDASLALRFEGIVGAGVDFDFEAIGFELPEIDFEFNRWSRPRRRIRRMS
jgi:hypothetical protein